MLRYVVLTHDFPTLHWDFMLEKEAFLRTWRIAAPPDTPGAIDAALLADHRLAYLDYEGPVSGNRGSVTRWDAGTYEILAESPAGLELKLHGTRLQGRVRLEAGSAGTGWTFRTIAESAC